jgi:hypothetical protein
VPNSTARRITERTAAKPVAIFSFRNNGTTPVLISSIPLSGATAGDFQIFLLVIRSPIRTPLPRGRLLM